LARRLKEQEKTNKTIAETVRTLRLELQAIRTSTSWRLVERLQRLAVAHPWLVTLYKRQIELRWLITGRWDHLRRHRDLRAAVALIRESALFDREWYLVQNKDVANSGLDPAWHYLEYGAREGRDPSPGFSTKWYLQRYRDVRESGINPLV